MSQVAAADGAAALLPGHEGQGHVELLLHGPRNGLLKRWPPRPAVKRVMTGLAAEISFPLLTIERRRKGSLRARHPKHPVRLGVQYFHPFLFRLDDP